jgi:vacuolar-type H+-ATPase subunit H
MRLININTKRKTIMSEESKKTVKEASEFFKRVSENAEKYQKAIPDKHLGEKLKRVSEGASEVVKHITERSGT